MINIEGLLARSSPMPTPFAPRIILSQNARTDLQTLARAYSTPQSLGLRARIVLRAADADTPTNLQIGRDLGCSNHTVGKWRRRYLARASLACRMPCARGVRERLPHPRVSRSSRLPARYHKSKSAQSPAGPWMRSSPPCLRPSTPMPSVARASGVSCKTSI